MTLEEMLGLKNIEIPINIKMHFTNLWKGWNEMQMAEG